MAFLTGLLSIAENLNQPGGILRNPPFLGRVQLALGLHVRFLRAEGFPHRERAAVYLGQLAAL